MKKSILLVFALMLLSSSSTFAAIIWNPDIPIQQIANNPGVIGDMSLNQPAGFTATQYAGTPDTTWNGDWPATYTTVNNQGFYDVVSPSYTVGAAIGANNIIPATFSIGVDGNETNITELLIAFNTYMLTVNGFVLDAANSFSGPVNIITGNNNGNGFSDGILSGFSLLTGQQYFFQAIVSPDGDGMEQFFIIPENGAPPVPEPATMILLGSGILGLAGFRKKIKI